MCLRSRTRRALPEVPAPAGRELSRLRAAPAQRSPLITVRPSSAIRTSGARAEICPVKVPPGTSSPPSASTGARVAVEPRVDAPGELVGPRLDGGHRPAHRLLLARPERPAGPGVDVGRVAAARGGVLGLREAGDLDRHAVDGEDGPLRVGERRVVGLAVVEAVRRSRRGSGIVSSPALRSVIVRSELLASFWSSGNSAATTSTGKSPEGSFSSWRSPPQPARTSRPARASALPRCVLLALKAGRTYHPRPRSGADS